MGNYDNGSNYRNNDNNSNAEYPSYSLNENRTEYYTDAHRKRTNTPLIVLTALFAVIAIVASTVAVTLILSKNSESNSSSKNSVQNEVTGNGNSADDSELLAPTGEETVEEVEEEPVENVVKTMYVDCNTTLTLRNGPGTDYGAILSIPTGDEVGYIKDAGNNFSKVRYNGRDGYVSTSYLSDTRPYVWYYNDTEVENFVEEVLYAFVTAINTDDVTYLTRHLSGQAVNDAYTSHNQVKKTAAREEVLSVNCHSVKRVSKTQVTVVRESTIRVYRYDGSVKDVTEKYITTVENTGNGMRVVGFKAL